MSESALTRWRSFAHALQPRMLLVNLAVGVLAGLFVAHVRLHLALPGHKVLLWMTPIIVARLLSRHPLGASVGASGAACMSLAFGANLAGGLLFLPLVGVAGAVIDAVSVFVERRNPAAWLFVPLIGLGGMSASLVCSLKRLLTPLIHSHSILGLAEPAGRILSYALFGLLAGLIGAGLSAAVLATRRSSTARPRRRTS